MKAHSNAFLGRTDVHDIADQQRRKALAQLLRDFQADLKDFVRAVAYRSDSGPHSNETLAAALEVARAALRAGEAQLEWKECQMLQGLSQQLIAKRITTSCRTAAGWLYWKVMSDLGLNC